MKEKFFATPEYITADEMKTLRRKLQLNQKNFARLFHVSQKTVERWESGKAPVGGAAAVLTAIFHEHPELADALEVPEKKYPLRLWYMYHNIVCTIIDVDGRKKKVTIKNYTDNLIFRAFGKNENPSFDEYEKFLESRCFPASRDKMKIILKELDIPFYDPLLIIEKTQGRMAEDDFWIRIER